MDYNNKRVGEMLRATRRQKKMSLQEVEGLSNQEFKASVLGAYERGERAVSVPRLWRLARFYGVEIAQLLPVDETGARFRSRIRHRRSGVRQPGRETGFV